MNPDIKKYFEEKYDYTHSIFLNYKSLKKDLAKGDPHEISLIILTSSIGYVNNDYTVATDANMLYKEACKEAL